jgi:hypothetical protein
MFLQPQLMRPRLAWVFQAHARSQASTRPVLHRRFSFGAPVELQFPQKSSRLPVNGQRWNPENPSPCQASTPVTVPPDNPFLEHSLVAHVPSHELPSLPQKFHEAWTLLVGFRPHWLFRFMQTRGRASSRHRRPSTRGSHAFLVRRRPEMASYFVCTPRCFLLRQGSVLKNSGSQVMMPAPDCSLAELGNLRLCALDA